MKVSLFWTHYLTLKKRGNFISKSLLFKVNDFLKCFMRWRKLNFFYTFLIIKTWIFFACIIKSKKSSHFKWFFSHWMWKVEEIQFIRVYKAFFDIYTRNHQHHSRGRWTNFDGKSCAFWSSKWSVGNENQLLEHFLAHTASRPFFFLFFYSSGNFCFLRIKMEKEKKFYVEVNERVWCVDNF